MENETSFDVGVPCLINDGTQYMVSIGTTSLDYNYVLKCNGANVTSDQQLVDESGNTTGTLVKTYLTPVDSITDLGSDPYTLEVTRNGVTVVYPLAPIS